MQALIDASKSGKLSADISLVVSSNGNAYGLIRAKSAKIPTFVYRQKMYDTKEEASQDLLNKLKEHEINYIALAGYLKLILPGIISAYNAKIINIHPGLLPKYGGKGMYGLHVHEAVLASGDKETGVTFHVVDERYDHGRIIETIPFDIEKGDTSEGLQRKIQEVENESYPIVLERFINGEYGTD